MFYGLGAAKKKTKKKAKKKTKKKAKKKVAKPSGASTFETITSTLMAQGVSGDAANRMAADLVAGGGAGQLSTEQLQSLAQSAAGKYTEQGGATRQGSVAKLVAKIPGGWTTVGIAAGAAALLGLVVVATKGRK